MRTSALVILLSIVFTSSYAQTVRRVNNTPGVTGVNVYTTAQAAHDAAVANDIIVIEPSTVAYGDLTLTKPLKIYGNGYFLGTNTELKADQRASILGTVNFNSGSSGSAMYGITANNALNLYGSSNITIQRCYLSSSLLLYNNTSSAGNAFANVSSITISQNYILSYVGSSITGGYTITNVVVNNNILNYLSATGSALSGWVVYNNTFNGASSNISFDNGTFNNNLMAGTGGAVLFSNTSYANNVSIGSTFSGGTANQNNYDVASDRVAAGTGISTDETYQLKTGSALKTAGVGGIEVGAFGGSNPYVISGIPAVPSIVSEITSGTGSNSTPLQVTISVKSNN